MYGEIIGYSLVRLDPAPLLHIFVHYIRQLQSFLADNSKGPEANPAELPTDGNLSIFVLLSKLFSKLDSKQNRENKENPIKFLSRYMDSLQ